MTPEQREELKAAALAATPGPYVLEKGDGELDSKARWPTDAKVLVFADDDCENHPVADFSCNHSCRMDFEQEKNALFFSLADPSTILSLIAQVEAMTRKTVELKRVYDERGLQIDRLEVELQRVHEAKIETQPAYEEIIRTGSMLMCTACGTTSKEPAWEKLPEVYFDEDAAPTIPAIPETKEGE